MSLSLILENATHEEDAVPLADPGVVQAALAEQETHTSMAASDASDDLMAEQETLGKLNEAVSEHDGELSAESLLFASILSEHIGKSTGMENILEIPNFESLKLDDKVKVSIENMDLAMEGILDGIKQLFMHKWSATVNAWRLTAPRCRIRIGQYKSLLNDLYKKGREQNASAVAIPLARLHENGGPPANFVKYINDYLDVSNTMIFDFEREAKVSYSAFIKAISNSKLNMIDSFEKELSKIVSATKDPRDRLPKQALTGPLPGGLRFFRSLKPQYQGNSSAAKKLDNIARANHPARAGFLKDNTRAHATNADIKALKYNEIEQLAKKTYSILTKIGSKELNNKATWDSLTALTPNPLAALLAIVSSPATAYKQAGNVKNDNATGKELVREVRKRYPEEIAALKAAHMTLYKLQSYVTINAAHCLVLVSDGLRIVLKKSIEGLV